MFDDCWLFGDNGIFCFGYFCDIHVFILELKAISFQLPFSFFFILVLPLPLIFLRVTHSKVVLHLFISFLSNLRVRFLRDVHTPHSFPPLFVIVFLSLIYLRSSVSFSLCYSYPFVFYIYIYMSGYRGANCIPIWQTRLIFSKGRIFAKNRQLPLSN